MSVFAALYSGVSGLQTYGSALGISADNIANLNTVGFKGSRARFTTLVTETSSSSTFSPGGVGLRPQTLVSRQGLIQASSSGSDLSVAGAGFFVVRNAPKGDAIDGEILFTRAGSFTPNEEGFLKNTAGDFLMGWPVDAQGEIPANLNDLNALEPIKTSGLTGIAERTDLVQLRANLQSSETVSALEATYDPTASGFNMATGAVPADLERSIQVFDSQGQTHTLIVSALKSATVNEWHVEIYSDPASETNNIAPNIDGQIVSGTLAFNTDGSIDVAGSTPALFAPIAVDWNNGASNSAITFDLGTDGLTDGFTQFDSISTLISSNVNGAVFGNVTGISIGKDGFVTALFDNGLSRKVFKLPVATFQAPDGLTRRQGNAYSVSDLSGNFNLVEAGTGGAGSIAPSTLEGSTVDLAQEFTDLITTQRAFTANTRTITTADDMLDELIRIKR